MGCHQTIGTSGTVGHVISTHQSGSQAVLMKTPHHPVSLVQITHVSGSHGTIWWWRFIICHWFACNLHKIFLILHCLLFNRRGRFIQHYLYVDEVLYKRSSLRQQLSRRLLPDGFRGRQMSSLHLHKCVEGFFKSVIVFFPHVPCTNSITRGDWYPPLLIKYLLICIMKL